jgi:hypothetical protein
MRRGEALEDAALAAVRRLDEEGENVGKKKKMRKVSVK